MQRHTHHLLGLLLFAMQPAAAAQAAQSPATPIDTTRWRALLLEEMKQTHTPGAALAVLVDGQLVFATAAGVRSIESGEPMTVETLVRTGSVTKMITGLTAARMAAAGKVDLDRPIGASARGLSPAITGVTLRDLLMHRSGLINEGLVDGRHDDSALGVRMRSWGGEMVLGPPRDVFSYSSPGYWLTGYLLEQVGRKPFADVVAEWLLKPLGMKRSTFRPTMAMTWPLALDHRVVGDSVTLLRPFQDDASSWPSGGLFSNVLELGALARTLLANGMVDGVRLLPAGTMQEFAVLPMVQAGSDCGYAYGLSKCHRGSTYTLGHYGFRVGSGAVFTLIPERGIGVIILANRGGGIFRATEEAILAMLAPVSPEPAAKPATAPLAKVASVAGRYVAGADTLLLVARRDSLFYRFGRESYPARLIGKDRIDVLDPSGAIQQEFRLVRGTQSRRRYLHDGLNAFAEVR